MIKGRKDAKPYEYDPAELQAMIFAKLKDMAEIHTELDPDLFQHFSSTVISIPVGYNDTQIQAVKDAALIADLGIWGDMITESKAAAIGYGLDADTVSVYFIFYHLCDEESRLALISVYRGDIQDVAVLRESNYKDNVAKSESSIQLLEQLLKNAVLEKTQIEGLTVIGDPNDFTYAEVKYQLERYLGKKALNADVITQMPLGSNQVILRGTTIQASRPPLLVEYDLPYPQYLQMTLGVELQGGISHAVMHRNYIVPGRKTMKFVTAYDNLEKVIFKIMEGARKIAKKKKHLGTLELMDIPRRPKGKLELDVVFEIDDEFVLTPYVVEKETGRKSQLMIPLGNPRYAQDELYKLVSEAEAAYDEDMLYVESSREQIGNDDLDPYGMTAISK